MSRDVCLEGSNPKDDVWYGYAVSWPDSVHVTRRLCLKSAQGDLPCGCAGVGPTRAMSRDE